jgi:hypothetical protein
MAVEIYCNLLEDSLGSWDKIEVVVDDEGKSEVEFEEFDKYFDYSNEA